VQAGSFIPEVLLHHPHVVRQLHRDFVHAGSDVVEALTYYAHREKLRLIGKEDELEKINKIALNIAKEVAKEGGEHILVAGNICNTNIYVPNDESVRGPILDMFREQIRWAKEESVDFIIAETFGYLGEALLALQAIKEAELPSVVTMSFPQPDKTRDGIPLQDAFRQLKAHGADVVGINCHRGPNTLLPLLEQLRQAVEGPIAALPVPYRTTEKAQTFIALEDPHSKTPHGKAFPTGLDPFQCTRYEIAEFTHKARDLGVQYFGVCCGAGPHHIRSMAEALGRIPPASRYSPDMSKHFALGQHESLKSENIDFWRTVMEQET
jgi:betaine-homocysteine S-methyltransferase